MPITIAKAIIRNKQQNQVHVICVYNIIIVIILNEANYK